MSALTQTSGAIRGAGRVVYLCGAGLSVPSGIRAYRSGPHAVWDEYVTDWGTLARFLEDPATWWKQFWLGAHQDLFRRFAPNAAHRALVRLMRRSPRDLVVTQNIDGLHRAAGHPEPQLIEIHGRHDRFVCTSAAGCEGVEAPVAEVDLGRLDEGVIPRCGRCGAPLRPLVLLFDELYDSHPAYQAPRARRALDEADVVVFVGTSFSVGITDAAVRSAALSGALAVNVNLEPAPLPGLVDLLGPCEALLPELAAALSLSPA